MDKDVNDTEKDLVPEDGKVVPAEVMLDRRQQKIIDQSTNKFVSPLGELVGAALDFWKLKKQK
ncbi:MAG: hypothetical protein NT116_04575 [Candidatus Parcubacteria bacterium]|nr:hypothetical protein [Candidatus Parcubacteria bacterium]